MSLDYDKTYFSDDTETEECWNLFTDDSPVIINSTYIDCYNTLLDIVNKYKYKYPERKFIIDNKGEKYTLVSLPKNYPTSYERIEVVANIICEE